MKLHLLVASGIAHLALAMPLEAATNTPAELDQWVTQLNADRYELRQFAQQKLLDAGADSIDALSRALTSQDVEGSRRSLAVLREFALRSNLTAAMSAESVIRELAQNRVTGTSYQAAAVLQSLTEMRSPRGLKILRQLGAKIRPGNDSYEEKVLMQSLGGSVIFITFDDAWRGGSEDLKFVEWLHDYRGCKVILSGAKFGDEHLAALAGCRRVAGLHLKKAAVTDRGMRVAGELPGLRTVVLQQCALTERTLFSLDRQPPLTLCYAFGCQFSKQEFETFAARNQDCLTRYGRGGFLGIGGISFVSKDEKTKGCEVQMVSPGQPADTAGIRVGDVITHFNGTAVTRFLPDSINPPLAGRTPPKDQGPSLAELIGRNIPGDRVKMTVLRDGSARYVEVELGDWP